MDRLMIERFRDARWEVFKAAEAMVKDEMEPSSDAHRARLWIDLKTAVARHWEVEDDACLAADMRRARAQSTLLAKFARAVARLWEARAK